MAGVGPTEGLPVPAPVQGVGSRGAGGSPREARRAGQLLLQKAAAVQQQAPGRGAEPCLVLTAPHPPLILILRATTPLPGCVPQGATAS